MKVMIVGMGSMPAEVSDRLKASGYSTVPVVYQGTPESLVGAIERHKDDLRIIYIEVAKFLFDGERFLWETLKKINDSLGLHAHRLLLLGWPEKIQVGERDALLRNLTTHHVNLTVVGERRSAEIANFLARMHQQEGAYLDQFGRIHEPSEQSPGRVAQPGSRVIPDKLPGPKHEAPPPVPPKAASTAAREEPVTTATSSPINGEDTLVGEAVGTAGTKPETDLNPRPTEEEALVSLLASPRVERALVAMIHAFFATLREGGQTQEVAAGHARGAARNSHPPAVSTPPGASETRSGKFSLSIVKASNPKVGDKAEEIITIAGIKLSVTRKVRLLLQGLSTTGTCEVGSLEMKRPLISPAFLSSVNKMLSENGVHVKIRRKRGHNTTLYVE